MIIWQCYTMLYRHKFNKVVYDFVQELSYTNHNFWAIAYETGGKAQH